MNPRSLARAQTTRGDAAKAAGDIDEAERHFRSALSAYIELEDRFSSAQMLSELADLRFQSGDYASAVDLNRQAAERMPGSVPALTGLGYALWFAGSPADAEATFTQALYSDPYAPFALAGRGQVRADLGRFTEALFDLDLALSRWPAQAEPPYRSASSVGPVSELADLRSARAVALGGLGRFDDASAEITAALELVPDRSRTHLRAARLAALTGDTSRATSEARAALAGVPTLSPSESTAARRLLSR
jgi:tetratricopeptide (TPR) repeat protein